MAEVHSDWLEPVPYQLLNISSITIVYHDYYILFIYICLYMCVYMEREKDHVGILKALKIYTVEQIVKPLNAVFPNCI